MAGPLVFYNDYIDFIEGYNLLKRPTVNVSYKILLFALYAEIILFIGKR